MKIKPGFELHCVCGEYVIVAYGEENIDFSKVISLNQSAALMWKAAAASGDFCTEDLAAALEAEYEVEHETAISDATAIVGEWKDLGLLS